jgi:peroxiredoxin
MSLAQELQVIKDKSAENIPKDKLEIMLGSTEALLKANLSDKALKTGDKLPDFSLSNAHGKTETLSEHLDKGAVVISFYRGGWCPYCNIELKALQAVLPEIKAKGANLIAITPETPDNSLTTSEKNELGFSILSDIGNTVAKKMGLVFQMPEPLREVYHAFSIDVPKHNGDTAYELPMPATYVVAQDGTITYAFVPEDYTERAEPKAILDALS